MTPINLNRHVPYEFLVYVGVVEIQPFLIALKGATDMFQGFWFVVNRNTNGLDGMGSMLLLFRPLLKQTVDDDCV